MLLILLVPEMPIVKPRATPKISGAL